MLASPDAFSRPRRIPESGELNAGAVCCGLCFAKDYTMLGRRLLTLGLAFAAVANPVFAAQSPATGRSAASTDAQQAARRKALARLPARPHQRHRAPGRTPAAAGRRPAGTPPERPARFQQLPQPDRARSSGTQCRPRNQLDPADRLRRQGRCLSESRRPGQARRPGAGQRRRVAAEAGRSIATTISARPLARTWPRLPRPSCTTTTPASASRPWPPR